MAAYGATGGTPAPAAKLPTPRPVKLPVKAAPKGPAPAHNKAPAHQTSHQRIHAAAQVLGAPRVRPWTEMGPGELKHYATKTVQQATKAELAPYQRRGGEINAQEANVAGRYGGYGRTTDTLLGNIGSEAGQSAKTFSNQIADIAARANTSIDSGGQASTDPQVLAQLQAERGNVAGIGAAGGVAAGSLGANEANFMANLRAAAAQKVTEGQGAIAGQFGKQRTENQGRESDLLGKQQGRITQTLTELTQKQFTNRATEAGLGIKLGATAQKGQEGAANRAQKETASKRTAQTSENNKRADLLYKETHPSGKSTNAPKAPSPAEGRKYMANISKAEAVAHQQGVKYGTNPKRLGEVRKYLQGLGYNGDQVSAAMNLAYYGRLGPQDRKTAEAYGLNGHMRPAWWGHPNAKATQ